MKRFLDLLLVAHVVLAMGFSGWVKAEDDNSRDEERVDYSVNQAKAMLAKKARELAEALEQQDVHNAKSARQTAAFYETLRICSEGLSSKSQCPFLNGGDIKSSEYYYRRTLWSRLISNPFVHWGASTVVGTAFGAYAWHNGGMYPEIGDHIKGGVLGILTGFSGGFFEMLCALKFVDGPLDQRAKKKLIAELKIYFWEQVRAGYFNVPETNQELWLDARSRGIPVSSHMFSSPEGLEASKSRFELWLRSLKNLAQLSFSGSKGAAMGKIFEEQLSALGELKFSPKTREADFEKFYSLYESARDFAVEHKLLGQDGGPNMDLLTALSEKSADSDVNLSDSAVEKAALNSDANNSFGRHDPFTKGSVSSENQVFFANLISKAVQSDFISRGALFQSSELLADSSLAGLLVEELRSGRKVDFSLKSRTSGAFKQTDSAMLNTKFSIAFGEPKHVVEGEFFHPVKLSLLEGGDDPFFTLMSSDNQELRKALEVALVEEVESALESQGIRPTYRRAEFGSLEAVAVNAADSHPDTPELRSFDGPGFVENSSDAASGLIRECLGKNGE